MLNPKTNVGKLKVASSLSNLHISKMAAKLKKNPYKSVEKHVKDAKLVQINSKASSHDWGSSLTSIYAFRIKNMTKG